MEDPGGGAAALLAALSDAVSSFTRFGQAQDLSHPPCAGAESARSAPELIHWRPWVSSSCSGTTTRTTGNQRWLLELPTVRTAQFTECLAVLADYTARLCAYDTVLDELGVPRTE
ncbi:MAG TPA: hypothetical protein VFW65_01230 [Pseudonocardiaceae bacterium]|nr:hypothetical protein [Pseudonocardiaceae bacterium]